MTEVAMPNFWTVCEDYALCKRWNEGQSVNVIADFLGRSRSAVTGRVKRLAKVGKITPRKSPLPESYIQAKRKPEPIAEVGITLLELTNNTCRFPITDALDRFCGEKTGGKTYCAECRKKVYSRG
jgi:hypothetical protein